MTTLVHKLARSMLAVQGIGSIWKLHSDAATLARICNYAAALSLSEIAEAAERELLRQRSNTGGIAIGSGSDNRYRGRGFLLPGRRSSAGIGTVHSAQAVRLSRSITIVTQPSRRELMIVLRAALICAINS